MDNERVISVLNGLIQTVKDGELGFTTAAEGIKDPATKTLFQSYARQRSEMARELQLEVRRLGGDPDRSGTVAGAAHRGWINIKSVVTGKDEGSIVAEAERGEDAAKKAYEEAQIETLPPQTLTLVRKQSQQVHEAHDRVRAIERATTVK